MQYQKDVLSRYYFYKHSVVRQQVDLQKWPIHMKGTYLKYHHHYKPYQ